MITVLDLQISYEGMKIDYANDLMLAEHLEQSKSNLFDYFHENLNYAYVVISTLPSVNSPSPSVQPEPIVGSPQKSFMAQYYRNEQPSVNELEEYLKLPDEDFDVCNPIHWWMGQ